MSELTTYLKQLKFSPKLKEGFFAKYIQNTRLVLLVVLLLCLIGFTSFQNLPRVLNPKINIPIVSVSTVLPGASPQDIESLLTVPIEDSVNGLEKVKSITSSSQDSVSVVTLEFESGVDPDKATNDVKSAVDSVTDLPDDAQSPNVQKFDFENEPVWTFVLSSDNNDSLSLVRFGERLRDELKDLKSVDKVTTTGLDSQEIQVFIKPEMMTTYGLNPANLSQTIQAATGSFPAGGVTTDESSFVLSLDPTVTTIEELRKLRITVQGTTVLLSDVADIRERNNPDATDSYVATKEQSAAAALRFDVYKASSANITDAVSDARKLTEEMVEPYHETLTILSILDTGEEISHQYNDLLRDFSITVVLVFITLFLFLGLRQAIVAAVAIPFSFLVTFIVMQATGMPLSFIAFFSLLLSLGLLVDDTIVIVSAITAYYRTKKFTALESALLVWRDFKTAIITTTLTTVWAFVPLLLSTGIIGEFIKAIPIVVSSTLIGSFFVAIFITLPLIIMLLNSSIPHRVVVLLRVVGVLAVFGIFLAVAPKGGLFLPALILFVLNLFVYFQVRYFLFKRVKNRLNQKVTTKNKEAKPLGIQQLLSSYVNNGVISFDRISSRYRKVLTKILSTRATRWKTIIIVTAFTLFSYLLLPLGAVNNEFFPKTDEDLVYLSLELPSGTNISQTNDEAVKILDEIRKREDVEFATATLKLSIDPGRGYAGAQDNAALITLLLSEDRKKSSIDIADELRAKYKDYQKGKLSVVELSSGPPAGSDLQIKLSGEDLTVLEQYADKIEAYLQEQPGVTNVSKSLKAGTSKVVFVPDYQRMVDADVTQNQVGQWLRTYASGFTLQSDAQLQEGSDTRQDIVLRTNSAPQTIQTLESLSIPTEQGPVPLNSLGTFELRTNPTLITREDGKRTLSVSAGVTKGVSVTEKNAALEKFADTLNLPSGYTWSTGGVNEENENSVIAIMQAMVLSFILIVVTMVLQFSSFRKAFIVMLVIPLSISGVFIIFALTKTPLSFPALIGILALFGIVVKNSILIVDKINQNVKTGMGYRESIVDASEGRLEPITLTSFATIIGLIPITLSDPLWQGLGGAIIAGLLFSGVTMLFFIPVVYYQIFKSSEGKTSA